MVAYLNVFEKLANSNTFFKKNEQDELEFQHSSLQLKLQNISEENINNILRNVHIEKTTEDMAISMGKILDKISENGGKVSASCLDGKSLKELKVLKKSLDEFYLNDWNVALR